MFRMKSIVLCTGGAFALAGCGSLGTSPSNTGDQPRVVQPILDVKHAVPNPDALYRIGRFYQGQRRYADAITAYRRALELQPGHADAQNGLGVLYAEQGRNDEAVTALQAAIAASPRAAHLHNNLGYVLLLQGANEKAVLALEEARRLEPGNIKVRDNLIIAYERLIEERTTRHPVQSDTKTAVVVRPEAQLAMAPVEVRSAPDSGVRLVAVAPTVYELQTSSTETARTQSGSDSAEAGTAGLPPAPGLATPIAGASTHADRPEALADVRSVGVVASGNETRIAEPHAPQQDHGAFKLEVSNGNGISGFAARVAGHLGRLGVATGRLTNEGTFSQPTTLIQYREGYRSHAARVGALLPRTVPVVQSGTLRGDIHVRVVLGQDVRTDVALFEPGPPTMQLATRTGEQAAR